MFYRYECQMKDGTRTGILTALDDIFCPDGNDSGITKILYYSAAFERYLDAPECTMSDTISYFTEKGNRRFSKAMRTLRRAVEAEGYPTFRIEADTLDTSLILYQDHYQVILLRE